VLSYVVVALALGFPLVVTLAWVFDVKAGGRVERTPPAHGLRGAPLAAVLVGIGVLAAAPGMAWYFFLRPGMRATPGAESTRTALDAASPAAGGRALPSIAVLPLVNLSRDPEQEYFADGLAEELLSLLAKVPGLHVAGRTSSFSFKGKNDDLRTIGQKLNVGTVLEGSVRRVGDRLRITTQLINASDGYHLWSESYDRKLTDVFAVQDEIARSVVAALKVTLLPGAGAPLERPATTPEAYAQFLLGRHLVVRGSPEGYKLGLAAFRKAVELDPKYAPAWAGVAKATFWDADAAGWYFSSRQKDLARALAAADKAIELGPNLSEGYEARGFLRQTKTTDWSGAQADFARALELSPGNAEALVHQGELLATLGRLPEGLAALRRAVELDPLSPTARWMLALLHLGSGHLEEARTTAGRALELFPEHAHAARTLGFALLLEGRLDESRAAFQRSSIPAFGAMGTALVEHARGHPRESQQALDHIVATWPQDMTYQIAEIYAFRGEPDRAFEWLDRALSLQDAGMRYLKHDPLVCNLRGDPRYAALLTKLNLPAD
jgi:TolB-like protein/Tfp pilus assembly protein PilF